jgi:uncharacterized membrane protein (UPF0127 family)
MNSALRLAALALAVVSLSACASGAAKEDHWVQLKGKRFVVELADDDAERERGLMFRTEMAADHGMLFVHDVEDIQSYWMKNTKIPLDILYFDHARKLVSVQRDVPPCSLGDRCPPFASEGPALYVLELNAGTAASLGVQPGDVLAFGPGVPERK